MGARDACDSGLELLDFHVVGVLEETLTEIQDGPMAEGSPHQPGQTTARGSGERPLTQLLGVFSFFFFLKTFPLKCSEHTVIR